jgi:sulfinoalanine decarboxylase/sulfinoalanine decarboxylase/aspartate 1-decarboxylase
VPADVASHPDADRGLLPILHKTLDLVTAHVAGEAAPLPSASREPVALAQRLAPLLRLGEANPDGDAVLRDVAVLLRNTPSAASPRFVNQLFGGREPVALAAELLAGVVNSSLYTFKAAGAQVLVEDAVLRRMQDAVGFTAGEGTFVPGGSLANLLAVLLARNTAWPTARDTGCPAAAGAIYTSTEGHYSIRKAAGMLGLGRQAVREIAVDDRGRIDVAALRDQLAADRRQGVTPLLVNATAGTTVRGAFDPLVELAELTAEFSTWLHVDGALGASLALSPVHRHLVAGLELADSVSWNPHKLMGVPLQCSALLVQRRGILAANLDESADYLFQSGAADFDPGHRSIQCGRRNDALKLWALWRHLGDAGWAKRIETQFELAGHAARTIAATAGLRLVESPPSVNVCFTVDGCDPAALCHRLDRDGTLLIGHGLVGGRRVMRLVCVNPELTPQDLDGMFAAILHTAARVRDPGHPD